MRSRPESKMRNRHRQLLVFAVLLVFLPSFTESCLPSWFRQTRSAAEPLESPTETAQKSLETNEIGEDPPAVITSDNDSDSDNTDFPIPDEDTIDRKDEVPPTLPPLQKPDDSGDSDKEKDEKLQNVVKELAKKEAEYEYEYEEEKSEEEAGEALKYNEKATKEATATLKPAVRKEIEKLKEAKCRDYCKHNATCHVEVIFRDDHVSAVVPSCHCPHGWEGTRCDRHYVQAFYAPVSGRYNQSSSSAVPAFAFLVIMLIMFIAIVVYAYRRMSKRTDDATYTMSHMCPPEAFTVLKTPNGRKISVHQCSAAAQTPPTATVIPVTPGPSSSAQRLPIRQAAVRSNEKNSSARNNFFSILRSQGTIPSRSINEDDTPKHYKSVPRVEVSAINYSGHIDFSGISFQSTESEVSKASATCPPPPAPPPQPAYFVIQMEQKEDMETNFRSPSRSSGEPGSPSTCEPMIPLKSPL